VCLNGSLVFTVPSASNTTYTWTASAGTSNSNSHTFNTSTSGAKTATVQLTVFGGAVDCQSGYATTQSADVYSCGAFTACPGITYVSAVTSEGGSQVVYGDAVDICTNKGSDWRLPTKIELQCLCDNRSILPGYFDAYAYWASETLEVSPDVLLGYHIIFRVDGGCVPFDVNLRFAANFPQAFVKCVK
jgi:hypothetical protein